MHSSRSIDHRRSVVEDAILDDALGTTGLTTRTRARPTPRPTTQSESLRAMTAGYRAHNDQIARAHAADRILASLAGTRGEP